MSQLLLTDLDESTMSVLEERANRNGRTPQDEAKAILADALAIRKAYSWDRVHAIYAQIAERGLQPNSVDLIREDRDR